MRSPSTRRELEAAQAATQLAQAATQAAQQQLQEVLAARVASVLLGRTASGHSLPIAARAQAATPTPPSPNPGRCGCYVHPTNGTIPQIVPPKLPSHAARASLPGAAMLSESMGYAHPSLGIVRNVAVPVPVSNTLNPAVGAPPIMSQAQPQTCAASTMVPAHASWYASGSAPGHHRQEPAAQPSLAKLPVQGR